MQGSERGSVKVLDLGAGKGGAARWLAKTYGCHVTCFNLGEKQNEFNKAKAVEGGIGELIDTHLGSFNEPLPMCATCPLACICAACPAGFYTCAQVHLPPPCPHAT